MQWAGDLVAALVHGGLGVLRFAHAEAAAQRVAGPSAAAGNAEVDPVAPQTARLNGVSTLEGVSRDMTPTVARTLVKQGLVGPLLQVGSPAGSCQLISSRCTLLLNTGSQMSLPPASACRKLYQPQLTKPPDSRFNIVWQVALHAHCSST